MVVAGTFVPMNYTKAESSHCSLCRSGEPQIQTVALDNGQGLTCESQRYSVLQTPQQQSDHIFHIIDIEVQWYPP